MRIQRISFWRKRSMRVTSQRRKSHMLALLVMPELLEYATWLGIDASRHKELLWIAKESLTVPLPDQWKPCLTEQDEIYYFNFVTGESLWDHPCDEFYRNVYKEKVREFNKHLEDCQPPLQMTKSQKSLLNQEERIKAKVLDEERLVLQQERIEMLERVGQVVQEDESQMLESLQQEMVNKIEKQLKDEAEKILDRRRKEMQKEIEMQIEAEKTSLKEVQRRLVDQQIQMDEELQLQRKTPGSLALQQEYKASDEQLKGDREQRKDELKRLLKEEVDFFESEKQKRLQERRNVLQEEEIKYMEKERQLILKKVNKEIEEEEIILFEKKKLDMVARIKQKVHDLEKSIFEKEHQLLIQRVREEIEQKQKSLQDKFEKEMEARLLKTEAMLKKQKSNGMNSVGNFDKQNDAPKSRTSLESESNAGSIDKGVRAMSNALKDIDTNFMIQKEMDLKRQVLQFIADFKDASLRQKIREEIFQLIMDGVLLGTVKSGNPSDMQRGLQTGTDSGHQCMTNIVLSDVDKLKNIQDFDDNNVKRKKDGEKPGKSTKE